MSTSHVSRDTAVGVLTGILIATAFFIALPRLSFLNQYLPVAYYNALPVSQTSDMDRDGIPDNVDDSDGDFIADSMDATPNGPVLHGAAPANR